MTVPFVPDVSNKDRVVALLIIGIKLMDQQEFLY